jgi:hypothetical protein
MARVWAFEVPSLGAMLDQVEQIVATLPESTECLDGIPAPGG